MSRARLSLVIAVCAMACADVAPAPSPLTEGATANPVAPANPRMALLPDASQAVLRRSRLPLMLPRDPALLARAIVTAGPHFTALSAQGEGYSVSISGTDHRHAVVQELAPPPPRDRVRGEPATFTVNDGIRSVSWDEASVAWAVDVECFDVENDPRCASDAFVRALAESLELVGGGP